ncbi:MAG TPA: peptide deformylase [Bacteroidota bacterium]
MVREIILLGNPVLREKCQRVRDFQSEETTSVIRDLADTLADFRARHGFGRGIAAPQIGSTWQIILLDFEIKGAMVNPKITSRSQRSFRLWDDCFSFPDLMVMVDRSYRVTVEYRDEEGSLMSLEAEGALAELLQHEIDHLNGILAIDRAIDSKHIILRSMHGKFIHQGAGVL